MSKQITWNPNIKLIVSDVDETIADLYVNAQKKIIQELEALLEEGKVLFLISGQGVKSIRRRIIDHINRRLRRKIIVGHCSGAEVFGFDEKGNMLRDPYYSIYEERIGSNKKRLRKVIEQLISEFHLTVFPTMPIPIFERKTKGNPFAIMVEDRGPQITFEVVNGYSLKAKQLGMFEFDVSLSHGHYDLRVPIIERAKELLRDMPITPRLGGVFAIDFAVEGVSKTTAVRYVLENKKILNSLGLSKEELNNPSYIEVWGDKYSVIRGGTDRHMSEALPKMVRSISFRKENPSEFPKGYNIVIWNGKEHLHDGLLEYLRYRNR